MRSAMLMMTAMLAACGSKPVEGNLVDGLTGQPLAGKTLLASAEGVSLTCQKISANSDDKGHFSLEGLCTGDAAYQVKVTDENLWLETATIPQGGFAEPTQFTAWRAPQGNGVYALSGETLTLLRTDADLKQETVLNTTEIVQYPSKLPNEIAKIKAGDFLVAVSKDLCQNTKIVPLVMDVGPRNFNNAVSIPDWWYIGVKFTSDTEFQRVEVSWDKAKEKHVESGERAFCFLPVDVLTAGRYAVMKPDDKRVRIVDVEG